VRIYLETGRLTLRRFTADDEDHLFELDSDPAVMRFITGGKPTPRAEIRDRLIPSFLSYYQGSGEFGYWAAEATPSGQFLGLFHFQPAQPAQPGQNGEAELGYRLRRAAWGNGYATEGCRSLIRKGFTELGVQRVTAQTMTVNAASRRVLEKSGMTYVRTINPGFTKGLAGSEHGDTEYAVTSTEWATWYLRTGEHCWTGGRQCGSASVKYPEGPAEHGAGWQT
jgi:RimJ/RimL family protein N-acetyltransferase